MELVIVIILVLLLLGSLPVYPHSQSWGYRGPGIIGVLLLIFMILWLLGGLPHLHRL